MMTDPDFTAILNELNIKDGIDNKLSEIYKEQVEFKNDNKYDSLKLLSY